MYNKLFNFLLTSLFLLFIFYITGISDFLLYEKLPDRMGATLGKVSDYDGIKIYFHILIPVLIIFTLLYSFSYDKLNNFFIKYKKLLLFTFVSLSLLSFWFITFLLSFLAKLKRNLYLQPQTKGWLDSSVGRAIHF